MPPVARQRAMELPQPLPARAQAQELAGMAHEATATARSERWLQHYGVERGNAGRVFKGEVFVEVR